MKSEDLIAAIGMVDEDLIEKANKIPPSKRAKRLIRWSAPIAAVLAVTIALGLFLGRGDPLVISAYALAEAEYPQRTAYPTEPINWDDPAVEKAFSAQFEDWRKEQKERYEYAEDEAALDPFFAATMAEFLQGGVGENRVYSPLNLYMAMAMLAEITDGESRAEILELIGVDDIGDLRAQAESVWLANYQNDGATRSILANSLWLNNGTDYVAKTVSHLAETYFASVFQGEMGSEAYNDALRNWLNEQTGGLLADAVETAELSPETVLALASTVYYQAKWANSFHPALTKPQSFHAESGDITCDFMHQGIMHGRYYWGTNFTATTLNLEGNATMWLILPDEGTSLQDLLSDREVTDFVTVGDEWANRQKLLVELSLPKFDISGQQDLRDGLKTLGISACFSAETSDFSPILQNDDGVFVSKIDHAARVAVDEDGVIAAAYTVIAMAGGAMAPTDSIDFTLDRPFLFVITGINGSPLFAGTVYEP